jgi:DNA integrity scanning protein DisA with diadenylate cyclase activity
MTLVELAALDGAIVLANDGKSSLTALYFRQRKPAACAAQREAGQKQQLVHQIMDWQRR